jgi:hypothetical protein
MEVVIFCFGASFFIEPIHVQLADKGMHVRVLKVLGQNLVSEFNRIFDNEACAIRNPVDNVFKLLLLNDEGAVTSSMSNVLRRKAGPFFYVFINTLNKIDYLKSNGTI